MLKRLSLAALLPLALVAAGLAIGFGGPAQAAPVGAATGLNITNPQCQANGTITARFGWSPSGYGIQFAEMTSRNDGFQLPYASSGALNSGVSSVTFSQLIPGKTYYARVTTLDAPRDRWLVSDTFAFSANCGGIVTGAPTAPTFLDADTLSATSIAFQWQSGQGNIWSCVDTAKSLQELYGRYGSWQSHDCWSTDNQAIVNGLDCGTRYYWRVYTWNYVTYAESEAEAASTLSCQQLITPPTDLESEVLSGNEVAFDWDPGQNNIWFCVDTATKLEDLYGRKGSWVSHNCWNTESETVVEGLECDTRYFWRVYAWNYTTWTETTHREFTTDDCGPRQVIAPIEDVTVEKVGDNYQAVIVVGLANGCESPGAYRVERVADEIEITVWNNHSGQEVCTAEFRTYELTINLGSDFDPGETYEVEVNNDEGVIFEAE